MSAREPSEDVASPDEARCETPSDLLHGMPGETNEPTPAAVRPGSRTPGSWGQPIPVATIGITPAVFGDANVYSPRDVAGRWPQPAGILARRDAIGRPPTTFPRRQEAAS
jgi:hypothetical protein